MNTHELHIRRATIDDLATLKSIWQSMQLSADTLESQITHFQIVERGGEVLGAIGFEIRRTAGLLHSEGYSDFSIADDARKLFWERLQNLAANHGVFRLWTQENSPFWLRWGFQPAAEENMQRLPAEWRDREGQWFTLELKNEDAVQSALSGQFAAHSLEEKRQSAEAVARAKKFSAVICILLFLIGFTAIGVAIWLFLRFKNGAH